VCLPVPVGLVLRSSFGLKSFSKIDRPKKIVRTNFHFEEEERVGHPELVANFEFANEGAFTDRLQQKIFPKPADTSFFHWLWGLGRIFGKCVCHTNSGFLSGSRPFGKTCLVAFFASQLKTTVSSM